MRANMNKKIIDLIENKFGDFVVCSTRLYPHTTMLIKDKKVIHSEQFSSPIIDEVNKWLSRLNKPKWETNVDQNKVDEVVIDEHGFWQFTLKV